MDEAQEANKALDNIEKLAKVADSLAKLAEVVSGHRAKLIAQGFSDEASSAMAVQLHATLLAALAGQALNRKAVPQNREQRRGKRQGM